MFTIFGIPGPLLFGQLLLGLINGAFYAMLSLGLAVIFGMLNIINFAHGALFMMGAFVSWMLLNYLGIGYFPSLILSPLIVGVFGLVLERTVISRLYKLDHIYGLLLTFGLALVIEGLFRNAYGSSGMPYRIPDALQGATNLGFMYLPNYRGVAVVAPGLREDQLAMLDAGGIRGVRLSTMSGAGITFEGLAQLAAEVSDFGWHILLHFKESAELIDVVPVLQRVKNVFVLDHLARVPIVEGTGSAEFRALLRLLDTDRCYVKLASLYRLSNEPYPHRDLLPLIHAVVAARPRSDHLGQQLAAPDPLPRYHAERRRSRRLDSDLGAGYSEPAEDAGRQPQRALRVRLSRVTAS